MVDYPLGWETTMLRAVLAAATAALMGPMEVWALDMNVQRDEQEKLAYVNMWGSVEPGDDAKFRELILPHVRAGYLIFKINIFSTGGNGAAAMGIGDQIRTLQARTVAPYILNKIVNNRKFSTGKPTCWFDESKGGYIFIKQVDGQRWCNCASACFLIWASGAVREGGYVGIHRLYWKGGEFGSLSPAEARARYNQAQNHYTAYLKRLDVPQTIIDRLFATDSQSMYYLTWPEHQLMQSTPYLEEMTFSRCGKSKTQHMSRESNWTATFDAQHINCYRGILKELMREGSQKYLAIYGP